MTNEVPGSVPVYTFGLYKILHSGKVLVRDGDTVPVSPKVLRTLVVLLEDAGNVVSKKQLFEAIWPDLFVEDGNLTQNIWVLRKLLAGDYPAKSPIETVARVGYRFIAPVTVSQTITVNSKWSTQVVPAQSGPQAHNYMPGDCTEPISEVVQARDPADAHPKGVAAGNRWLTWSRGVIIGLFLLAATFTTLEVRHVRAKHDFRAVPPRIALLPFRNLSGSPDQAWLSSALRETLFTDLAAGTGLRMTPEEDVVRAQRELHLASTDGLNQQSLVSLCRDLDCNQVVSGHYLISGGNIRIDTQLTDVRTGETLLTFSKTGTLSQLLPLIDDTGIAIRKKLHIQSDLPDTLETLSATISSNPEAYQLYLQGLDALRSYDGNASASFERRSLQIDPTFPLAHLALSSSLTILGQEHDAVAEARQAKALDSRLSREQQLLIDARLASAERRFDDAASVTRTLYAFYPDNPDYLLQTAAALSYAGHPQSGIDVLRPLSDAPAAQEDPQLDSILADCYALKGDWQKSLEWAQKGVAASQRRGATVLVGRLLTSEAQALLYLHHPDTALSESREALTIAREFSDYSGEFRALNRIGQADTALDHLPDAEAMLEEALSLERQQGQMQRQLHTLSALGLLRSKQGDSAGAETFFRQELEVAQKFNQPEFLLGAQLDVLREHWLDHHDSATRTGLQQLAQKATAIQSYEIVSEAQTALRQ